MLSKRVAKTCGQIKALEIQGARKIAKAAVQSMAQQADDSDAETKDALMSDLLVAADELAKTRPTEPMLQNSLRFLFAELQKEKPKTAAALKKAVKREEKELLVKFEKNASLIADYGAREIPEGASVLIHCHSNTVMGALKKAQELGKNPKVICTETRPRFQGRLSAKELSEAGLDVTMIVDSGAKYAMKEFDVDVVLVGGDAVSSTGDLINKIGTSQIASCAYEQNIKMFSCIELYKFDPLTMWGKVTEIEERDPSEIADQKKFKGVRIWNPAFDRTPAKYLTGYITEKGIVSPQGLLNLAIREFKL